MLTSYKKQKAKTANTNFTWLYFLFTNSFVFHISIWKTKLLGNTKLLISLKLLVYVFPSYEVYLAIANTFPSFFHSPFLLATNYVWIFFCQEYFSVFSEKNYKEIRFIISCKYDINSIDLFHTMVLFTFSYVK